MQKTKCLIAILISYGFMFSSVWAHDYWIMPETFQPKQNSVVEVSFTSAHKYFENEEIPDITKFRLLLITPLGQEIPLAYSRVEPKAALAKIPICGQGTYIIGATSTRPEYWCKTTNGWEPGKRAEYVNVVNAGKYVKSVKTFISVGQGSESFKKTLGHTIEIVPQVNPSMLKPGQQLTVSVLFKGRPVGGIPVFGIYEGFKSKEHSDRPIQTQTDANGTASVKVDRPGKWVVFAKYELDKPGEEGVDYANYRPYIMFEVQ